MIADTFYQVKRRIQLREEEDRQARLAYEKQILEEAQAMSEDKVQILKDASRKTFMALLSKVPILSSYSIDGSFHGCSPDDILLLGQETRKIKILAIEELGLPLMPAMRLMDTVFDECCRETRNNYSDSFIVETQCDTSVNTNEDFDRL